MDCDDAEEIKEQVAEFLDIIVELNNKLYCKENELSDDMCEEMNDEYASDDYWIESPRDFFDK